MPVTTQPTITFYEVTDCNGGVPQNEQIKNFNQGGAAGGPVLTLDFPATEAGFWSRPKCFIVGFAGNTVKNLGFRLWDTGGTPAPSDPQNQIITSLGEDLVPEPANRSSTNNWWIRTQVTNQWVDPTTYSTDPNNTPIGGWADVAVASQASNLFDSLLQSLGNGNDYSQNLLVEAVNSSPGSPLYYTNFFIYVSALPKLAATAGTHTEWGFRLSYQYPGNPIV